MAIQFTCAQWRFTIVVLGHELYTMPVEMVLTHTSIPITKFLRGVYWRGQVWMLMEYIEGVDLQDAWRSLRFWKMFWLAWTFYYYIQQLWHVKLNHPDIPGLLDWSETPLKCISHYITSIGAGSFDSYHEMSVWFASNYCIAVLLEAQARILNADRKPYLFDNSIPLVPYT
jgi:hypothetical protein